MSEIKITYLNQGAGTLLDRAIDLFGVDIHSFIIGDAVDFDADPNETAPRGNITFTGDKSLVKIKYLNSDKDLRISLVIPEEYNGIEVGNIVVYALHRGTIKPVISIVLPNLVKKEAVFPDFEPSTSFKYPSTRLIISLTVKYVDQQPFDDVTINVVSPEFSNLPFYGHSSDVPPGNLNPYQQFLINQMDMAGGVPALVTKDLANSYWSTPLWQDINSPKYGILDGGQDGDNYEIDRTKWLWGGWFITPDAKYNGLINGGSFVGGDANPVLLGFTSF